MSKNIYYWSLDISTTNIGLALWDSNGKLVELKHLELKLPKDVPVEDRDLHKAEIFRKYVAEYKNYVSDKLNGNVASIFVEEPLGGSNNANTVSLLFGFNGICRYILYQIFDVYPKKISVHDSRKIFCKEYVREEKKNGEIVQILSFPKGWKSDEKKRHIWEKVCKLEPQIEWFYKKDSKEPKGINYDMSDSYCVGYSSLVLLGILK